MTGKNKEYYTSLFELSEVLDPNNDDFVFSFSVKVCHEKNVFIADTSIIEDPNSQELAEMAIELSELVKMMGDTARVAFLSFSNFGDSDSESIDKIKEAIRILDIEEVDFEYDGEMTADIALSENIKTLYPFCKLSGPANILIMPDLASASISTKLLKSFSGSKFVGPIISGFKKAVQIVHTNADTNTIIKVSSFGCLDAINKKINNFRGYRNEFKKLI